MTQSSLNQRGGGTPEFWVNPYRTVYSSEALTAGLLGLTRSLLSSGFFPAFSGRWRGEPSDLEEAEEGGKKFYCERKMTKGPLPQRSD